MSNVHHSCSGGRRGRGKLVLHARLMAAKAAEAAAAVSVGRRRGPQPHRRRELLLLLPGTDGDDVEGEDGKARAHMATHELNGNANDFLRCSPFLSPPR